MNPLKVSAASVALVAYAWFALVVAAQGNGSEEKTPPAAFNGPPVLYSPPPPPPPQPLTAVRIRVDWQHGETGSLVLRIQAHGAPGAPFLLGAVRPGSARPTVIAAAMLDADGAWSLEREIAVQSARACAAVEFVAVTR